MAYETGTASGPTDLVNKLIAFATANGWTVNNLTISKSGTYSQSVTTGVITVTITGNNFLLGEVLSADFTSGTAVDGNYAVTGILNPNSFTLQGALVGTTGNVTLTSTAGYVFQKGGMYFGLAVIGTSDIYVCGATGYSSTSQWHQQPGASSVTPRSNAMTGGPYQAYHFFTNTGPDYLHAVVEVTAGIFKHILLGKLVKSGTFTGGEYAQACYWEMTKQSASSTPNYPDGDYHQAPFDGHNLYSAQYRNAVRADIDGKTNNWMAFSLNSTWTGNSARGVVRTKEGILDTLHARSPSEFNQITPLLPMLICVDRPSSMTSPLGYVPDVRYVNMTNYTPGELVTIGGTEWLVFPLVSKTNTWSVPDSMTPSSGTYGLAYKRN